MNNIKAERMKSDLRNGLATVFLKKGLNYVVFTDIYISRDFRYAKIEIDVINKDLPEVVSKLNGISLHKEIVKDLHNYTSIKNFPKIIFIADSHKKRIEKADELLHEINVKLVE